MCWGVGEVREDVGGSVGDVKKCWERCGKGRCGERCGGVWKCWVRLGKCVEVKGK